MDIEKAKIRADLDALTSSVNSALAALAARLTELDALAVRVTDLTAQVTVLAAPPEPRKKYFEFKQRQPKVKPALANPPLPRKKLFAPKPKSEPVAKPESEPKKG